MLGQFRQHVRDGTCPFRHEKENGKSNIENDGGPKSDLKGKFAILVAEMPLRDQSARPTAQKTKPVQ
jgi:hypothetical protein